MNDAAMTPPLAQAADHAQFVTWLRQVAPYVHAHRGRTFVIAFSGSLIANGQLTALIQDVSLLSAMGIRIVLVHGSRPQVQAQLALKGIDSQFHNDVRITDAAALECAKEAAGEIRLDIEAAFSQGLPSTPMAHSKVRVISGNFVTARPMGIIDGVDLQLTGVVRKVDTDALRFVLANGGLVLLSPLGFSPTGEAFNLTMEDVACSVATALKADKLVLLTETAGINGPDGALRSELSMEDAENMLAAGEVSGDAAFNLRHAIRACRGGVARAHILSFAQDGGILVELFTHDGVGTMVAPENLEKMRDADRGRRRRHHQADRAARGRRHAGQAAARTDRARDRSLHRARARRLHLRLRGALSVPEAADRRTRLPHRASAVPGLRRRRAADEAHRGQGEGCRHRAALRADDAHRALLHQARLQAGDGRRPAADAAEHVQLAAPLAGADQDPLGERKMARMVQCVKLGREAEGLEFPPVPGELGKRIWENVSKEAWAGWLKHQTMLVNENRLNLADTRARKYLLTQMEKHFFGEGADAAAGYVPPST